MYISSAHISLAKAQSCGPSPQQGWLGNVASCVSRKKGNWILAPNKPPSPGLASCKGRRELG